MCWAGACLIHGMCSQCSREKQKLPWWHKSVPSRVYGEEFTHALFWHWPLDDNRQCCFCSLLHRIRNHCILLSRMLPLFSKVIMPRCCTIHLFFFLILTISPLEWRRYCHSSYSPGEKKIPIVHSHSTLHNTHSWNLDQNLDVKIFTKCHTRSASRTTHVCSHRHGFRGFPCESTQAPARREPKQVNIGAFKEGETLVQRNPFFYLLMLEDFQLDLPLQLSNVNVGFTFLLPIWTGLFRSLLRLCEIEFQVLSVAIIVFAHQRRRRVCPRTVTKFRWLLVTRSV